MRKSPSKKSKVNYAEVAELLRQANECGYRFLALLEEPFVHEHSRISLQPDQLPLHHEGQPSLVSIHEVSSLGASNSLVSG